MANLYLSVKGQTLTVKSDIDKIVENSINYLKINIDTSQDSEWSDPDLNIKCILSNKEKSSTFYENNYITEDFLKTPGFVVHLVGYELNEDGETYKKLIPTNPVVVNIHSTGVLDTDDEPEDEIAAEWVDKVVSSVNETINQLKQEQSIFIEETNTKITFIENKAGEALEKTDEVRVEISAIGDRVDELIDVEILSPSNFVNGTFKEGEGIVASDYWIIIKKSIPVKIGDKVTIKPNGLKVWWRIHNSDDLSVAVNVSQDAHKVITEDFAFTSEYDGWFNVQIRRVDNQRITPSDYICDIKVGTSIFEKIENLENNISQKQDELKDGENIKTINGESILGSGNITIGGDEETSTSSGTLFSKHVPFTHIVDDCQDATKWTITNTSSELESVDTTNYIFGDQSLRSDGTMRSIKNTYDLANNYLVLKLRINSIGTGSRLLLSIGNTSAPSTRVVYELGRGTSWTTPEGWQEIVVSSSNYSYGSADAIDFSNINDLYFMTQTLSGTGTAEVDWNLQYVGTRPKTTNKGIVTFTFDDGWESQYTGVKLLAEKGITSTLFTIKEAVESNNYLTLDEIKSLVNLYGTDIEVHGDPAYTNPIWTEDKLKEHWSESQKFIRENGLGEGRHMAYPNGMFPENIVELAKDYFDSCRTIIPFMPTETLPVADRYRIRAVSSVGEGVKVNTIKQYIDRMSKDGGWLVLVLHKIGNAVGDTMYCSEEDLSAIADYAIDSGVDIMNYAEVMERFYADLSPEKVPTVSGEDIVIPENVETTDNKVSTIEDNMAEDKYPTVSAVRDYVNKYKHIVPITEDVFAYDLDDGIYHIDGSSEATIFFDDGGSEGLQEGLLLVKTIQSNATYSWTAIGRNSAWLQGIFTGYTEFIDGYWTSTYSMEEKENNKVSIINDITNNNTYYPTVKAVTEYVESKTAPKVFEKIATAVVEPDTDGNLPTKISITKDDNGNAFELTDIYCDCYIGLTDGSEGRFYISGSNMALMGNFSIGLDTTPKYWCFRCDSYGEGNGGLTTAAQYAMAGKNYPNANFYNVLGQLIPPGKTLNFKSVEFIGQVGDTKTFVEGTTITLWGVRK